MSLDCHTNGWISVVLIMGSNAAENHPVAFKFELFSLIIKIKSS